MLQHSVVARLRHTIKEQLKHIEGIEGLTEGHRMKLRRLLEGIEKHSKGAKVRHLIKDRSVGLSNRTIYTLLTWLSERDYTFEIRGEKGRRRRVFLTPMGRDALIKLKSFEDRREQLSLNLKADLEMKETRLTLEAFTSNVAEGPALALGRQKLHSLAIAMARWLPEILHGTGVNAITIRMQDSNIDFRLLHELKLFWSRFCSIIEDDAPSKGLNEFQPPDLQELRRYQSWWEDVEKEVRDTVSKGGKIDFSKILGAELVKSVSQDEKLRAWIDKKLEDDPDWFMPHFLWVQLGFKQRRSIDTPSKANPPIVAYILNPECRLIPELLYRMVLAERIMSTETVPEDLRAILGDELDELGRDLTRKSRALQAASIILGGFLERHQREAEMYEAWKYVRLQFHPQQEFMQILDAALLIYLFKGRPCVDLASAFTELIADPKQTVPGLVEQIRRGGYRLKAEGSDNLGSL